MVQGIPTEPQRAIARKVADELGCTCNKVRYISEKITAGAAAAPVVEHIAEAALVDSAAATRVALVLHGVNA